MEYINDLIIPESPLFVDASWALINLLLMILITLITATLFITLLIRVKKYDNGNNDVNTIHSDKDNALIARRRMAYAMFYASINKNGNGNSNGNGNKIHYNMKIRILSLILTFAAIIMFIMTQNMSNPMIMVDSWTIWKTAILIVQVIIAVVIRKSRNSNGNVKDKVFA
ncbi:MAG: hypothetical protein LBD23_11295 [Oscillospiraceae bacterium]|nr:hypothetical protein [Oscillospiraceae bacterium]